MNGRLGGRVATTDGLRHQSRNRTREHNPGPPPHEEAQKGRSCECDQIR